MKFKEWFIDVYYIVMIILAAIALGLAVASKANAQSYQRVESSACSCNSPRSFTTSQGITNMACDLPLSIDVNITQLSTVKICYGIFGNARTYAIPHDGVNSWVTGPANMPVVASGELIPEAILNGASHTNGAAAVNVCDTIQTNQSFTAQVEVAFYQYDWSKAPDERWGCMSKKMNQPSWLTVEIE